MIDRFGKEIAVKDYITFICSDGREIAVGIVTKLSKRNIVVKSIHPNPYSIGVGTSLLRIAERIVVIDKTMLLDAERQLLHEYELKILENEWKLNLK